MLRKIYRNSNFISFYPSIPWYLRIQDWIFRQKQTTLIVHRACTSLRIKNRRNRRMYDDSHFAVIAYSFLSFREKRKMHGKPGWTCKFPPICITISCYFALAFQTKFHFYISVSNLAQITLLLRRLLFFNAFVVALNILFLVPEKITDEITTNNNNNNNNKKQRKFY